MVGDVAGAIGRRGRRNRTIAAALGLGIVCAGCASVRRSPTPPPRAAAPASRVWRGHPVDVPTPAPPFALRDQTGRLIRLSSERGKVVVVTFLYARCRDVCPLIAANLASALRRLGARQPDVLVLAVSVDPAHDTPSAVRDFVSAHALPPEFHYLTGTRARLQPVWQSYNVLAAPRNASAIDHSASILLVDRVGRMRVYLDPTATSAAIAHDLRRLLAAS